MLYAGRNFISTPLVSFYQEKKWAVKDHSSIGLKKEWRLCNKSLQLNNGDWFYTIFIKTKHIALCCFTECQMVKVKLTREPSSYLNWNFLSQMKPFERQSVLSHVTVSMLRYEFRVFLILILIQAGSFLEPSFHLEGHLDNITCAQASSIVIFHRTLICTEFRHCSFFKTLLVFVFKIRKL